MIALAKPVCRTSSPPAWHAAFLAMLPAIRAQAHYAFRNWPPAAREEALEEATCHTCVAFARLAARGKAHVASPTSLVRFAVKQYRAGRRVGCPLNVHDISSEYCQVRKRVSRRWLAEQGAKSEPWGEMLLEDRHAGPAETAAARIDLAAWLQQMRPGDRRLALALGMGERTSDVARQFGISPGRVSQKRRAFRRQWEAFQGGPAAEERPTGRAEAVATV